MFKKLYQKDKYLPLLVINAIVITVALAITAPVLIVVMGSVAEAWRFFLRYVMSDLGQVIYFTLSDNPYVTSFSTSYLPLNFLILYPFALICKNVPQFYALDSITVTDGKYSYEELIEYNVGIAQTPNFWITALLFYAVCFAVLAWLLYTMKKWESKKSFAICLGALSLSALIMFGLFRGTNVFVALIFVLLFLNYYKHANPYVRELALVCLAISGVLKIYPLLFGVVLLKEKKFLPSVRVALYFVVFALLPFALYGNIFTVFGDFCKNMFGFVSNESRLGSGMNISIYSAVKYILVLLHAPSAVVKVVATTAMLASFAVCVAVALKTDNKFVLYMVTAVGVIAIPPVSYYYVTMFLILPLLEFETELKKMEKPRKIFYLAFFACMAFLPFSATMWYVPQSVAFATVLVWEAKKSFARPQKTDQLLSTDNVA